MYIDGEICGASSEQKCRSDTSATVSDLELAGFVLNITKSRLKPEQVGVWLGFILDLKEGKLLVPEDKVALLVKSIDGILTSSSVHVRWLASAVGQIIT